MDAIFHVINDITLDEGVRQDGAQTGDKPKTRKRWRTGRDGSWR